jgi:GrpB-like predicted nucleotidyltransferase (UPF0157 family)/uncharacterized protein YndB with AHSA1/START domain
VPDAAPSTVELRDHDPAWAQRYARERAAIVACVGDNVAAVEHVGSTSVAGLVAKPVIDVVVLLHDFGHASAAVGTLCSRGYTYVAEYEHALPTRRFLYLGDRASGTREVNLHMYEVGDPEAERHLLFRDALRADDTVRDAYARLKREIAARTGDIDEYTDAKSEFIRSVERSAIRGRAVERIVHVTTPPEQMHTLLSDPQHMRQWYAPRISRDGAHLSIGFDEEYGYSRQYTCTILADVEPSAFAWRWDSCERRFDGSNLPDMPLQHARAHWQHDLLGTRLSVRIDLARTESGGTRVHMIEHGYGDDASWDATMHEHSAWWAYYLARLAELAGRDDDAVDVRSAEVPASRARAWRALTTGRERAAWLAHDDGHELREGARIRFGGVPARVQRWSRERRLEIVFGDGVQLALDLVACEPQAGDDPPRERVRIVSTVDGHPPGGMPFADRESVAALQAHLDAHSN